MAGKTTKGSGSIIQLEKDKPKSKCRKWQLRVSTSKGPKTGKYVTKVRAFKGTLSDAKSALREFIEELEGNRIQGKTSHTLREYCDRYLEERRAKKEVTEATLGKQEWQFKAVCHHIGGVKLEDVTPQMLNNVYVAMMQGDTLSGRKSGGSYVNQIHDNITLVFQRAVKEGILVANPCDMADSPRMDTKPKKAMQPDKVRELVAELDPTDPHECSYLLKVTLGLRRGEICGLSWGDVDFERNVVDVSHSYDSLGNLKGTKTKAGMRLLPLSPVIRDALLKMKEAQAAQFAKTNSSHKPEEGYLEQIEDGAAIAGHYGERVKPGTMSRWWAIDRESFDLGGFTLHELRHTCLTMLAMGNVHPKVMQELTGHYSSQITMDIYTHVNMDAKRQAVEAVSKLF